MSSVLGILGPVFATAAESYLRSVSPQAALEREQMQAQRQLIPMKLEEERLKNQFTREGMEPRLDLLRAQAEHQRQVAQKGGQQREIIRQSANKAWKWNQATKTYDLIDVENPVHGEALRQDIIQKMAEGTATPGEIAILDEWHRSKTRFVPPTDTRPWMTFNPFPGVQIGAETPGAAQPPAVPSRPTPSPTAPRQGAPRVAAPASPGTGAQEIPAIEPQEAQIVVRQNYLTQLGLPGSQKLLTETMQADKDLQAGSNPNTITMAWIRAFQRAHPGQDFTTPALQPQGKGRPAGGTPGTTVSSGSGTVTTGARTPEQEALARAKEEDLRRKGSGLPAYKTEQVAKAVELFPFIGNPPRMELLTPAQLTVIDQVLRAEKEETGFYKILKQAQPLLSEQASMDSSANFAKQAESLIAPTTVGTIGRANRARQQVIDQMPIPDAAKRRMGGFDERIPELEVVAHAIGYIHANAMKRIGGAGGGGGRGVTQFDIKEITGWFDPFSPWASVRSLRTKLRQLQDLIQMVRPQVEQELRVLGVDPKTHGQIKGYRYGDETPESSGTPASGDANEILKNMKE